MKDREIRLNVADIVVSLAIEPGVHVLGHVDSFLVDGPAEATVNMRFNREHAKVEGYRQLSIGEAFGWNAFGTSEGKSILVERLGGGISVRFASEPGCEVVDVLLSAPEGGRSVDGRWPERELLLVEVLPLPVVVLLSGRKGLFLHSCAVDYEENGILFSGVSGSGKSTMADLWRRFGPPTSSVIDDEHIIARCVENAPLLYGAPWSRGQREATFSRTAAKAIFFLSHGRRNRCVRLSSSEALAQLLSQVFLPVWSREQVELTVQTCAELLQAVDCYRLEFFPDPEIIGFVQGVLEDSL
jgi:hypothetical protein